MVKQGDAHGMIAGLTTHYPDALRPPLQVIRTFGYCKTVAGVYMVATRQRVVFFADATVNIDPDAETLAEIAIMASRLMQDFDIEPRVAMLSYSNFGSVRNQRTDRVREAVEIVRRRVPDLLIEGEMQAGTALVEEVLNGTYPFNRLRKAANVLIFPDLAAGNIAFHLMQQLANAEVVGPILVGISKPVHVVSRESEVNDIVNLAALAAVKAQRLKFQAPLGA
jgi:malate dehydrogenase (oxaloacetate-decarboxylating)(NADP+)